MILMMMMEHLNEMFAQSKNSRILNGDKSFLCYQCESN